jgi:Na+/H+-translocating membrane pyrophosphatase
VALFAQLGGEFIPRPLTGADLVGKVEAGIPRTTAILPIAICHDNVDSAAVALTYSSQYAENIGA